MTVFSPLGFDQDVVTLDSDVDLIPENDQNLYSCWSASDHPIHMSYQVRFQPNGSYTGIYSFLVGGVLTIRPNVFRQLNGFSNQYFDWGGEDDDMGLRLLSKDVCVQRPTTGYYYATSHAKQKRNPDRFALLFDAVLRQDTDGLSDIDQLASISHVDEYPLVTWMKVQWTKNRSSNSHSTSWSVHSVKRESVNLASQKHCMSRGAE